MGGNVWLLKGYFDTVPKELDEAAKVDGASHARVFFTITLPLITPILVTVGMIQFIGLFNAVSYTHLDVYKRQLLVWIGGKFAAAGSLWAVVGVSFIAMCVLAIYGTTRAVTMLSLIHI